MSIITPRLLSRILDGYTLSPLGTHGLSHWARVLENGRRLASLVEADAEVIELFAVFHDARRINDGFDHSHGKRGAELARRLRGEYFEIDDARFALLEYACAKHTSGLTEADGSVQVCWDADRLDLLRVGIKPQPKWLCTNAAKDPDVIQWANSRSIPRYTPTLIQEEWKLDLGNL
jgi:uncharacterized protein